MYQTNLFLDGMNTVNVHFFIYVSNIKFLKNLLIYLRFNSIFCTSRLVK